MDSLCEYFTWFIHLSKKVTVVTPKRVTVVTPTQNHTAGADAFERTLTHAETANRNVAHDFKESIASGIESNLIGDRGVDADLDRRLCSSL